MPHSCYTEAIRGNISVCLTMSQFPVHSTLSFLSTSILAIIPMSSTQEQRKRTEAGLCHDISGPKASKWLKLNTRLHSAAFYDSLSKVWLTRRALKELDRRKIKVNSLQRPASMPSQVTRKALEEIQRFARDGGPDLRDLRGVIPNS